MGNFAENLNLGNRFRPPWARGCSPRNTKSLEEEFQVEKERKKKNLILYASILFWN